jgi:hypothetical protein
MPFINATSSPDSLARFAERQPSRDDTYVLQARAYSKIATKDFDEAILLLRKLSSSLGEHPDRAWVAEIKDRADKLVTIIKRDPSEAEDLLRQWERKTKSNLRLE